MLPSQSINMKRQDSVRGESNFCKKKKKIDGFQTSSDKMRNLKTSAPNFEKCIEMFLIFYWKCVGNNVCSKSRRYLYSVKIYTIHHLLCIFCHNELNKATARSIDLSIYLPINLYM